MTVKAPEIVETERLILRRPLMADAEEIFSRYASDPEVTRYLAWPRHTSLQQTREFLSFSDDMWNTWSGGPYLVESRVSHELLGSTGFDFKAPDFAAVGYVLARVAWGAGYATEALRAITGISATIGIRRLEAYCHPTHERSARILEKCGFVSEGTLERKCEFPNLEEKGPLDVLCYSMSFG